MKKALTLFLCLAVLIMPLVGCGGGEKELRKIVINEVTRSVFYAPLYVAQSEGFFEAEGFDVEIVTGGGSDKSMTALLSGEAQVALAGPETGVYVVNQGKSDHPMIIAQLTKRDGSFLLGREEDASFSIEKMRGKSVIGGRPGGMPFMTLEYILKKNGLTPGVDVTVIDNIQFNLVGGAFESGTGDYVTLFEPLASDFDANGRGHIVANVGLLSGEVPYTTFMVTQDTIKNDSQFVEAFVRAIYKAQLWVASATDDEIAKAMQPFFPDTSLETLATVAKSYRATDSWTQVPTMTEDAFNRLQDIIESAGELTARINLTDLVDNSFGEKAIRDVKN